MLWTSQLGSPKHKNLKARVYRITTQHFSLLSVLLTLGKGSCETCSWSSCQPMSWGWSCSPKANSKIPIGYACYVQHNLDSYSARKIVFLPRCKPIGRGITNVESAETGNLQLCLRSLDIVRLSCRAVWHQTSLWTLFCCHLVLRASGTAAFGTFSLAVVLSSHFERLLKSLQGLC